MQLTAKHLSTDLKNNETGRQTIKNKILAITIRFGQGGFSDKRSPINQLGGGQIALDLKPAGLPVAFSISGEYYTNSPEPTHPYEISDLTVLNCFYVKKSGKMVLLAGGGFGKLKVPRGEDQPDQTESSFCFNLEAGINHRLFWKIGLYGIVKYLYAQKSRNQRKVIAFNEAILLLGLTLNFAF